MTTRPPAVAGAFYPGVARTLDADVRALLADAGSDAPPAPVKALIVPHAGYVYSGPTAARAFALLAGRASEIRRVVLLGPAHRVAVRGLAAPRAEAFATPLGSVPVDREGIADLLELSQVGLSDEAHALEHSLEVQLPFLQRVLGDFVLLPLVVGEATDEEVSEVLDRVWGGPETLLLVSSDLSHYYDYETARRLDAKTCAAIERLDPAPLDWESACGRVPVRGLLTAARRHGLTVRTVDLCSSGDTAGDRDRVVGYGAWAFAVDPSDARRGAGADRGGASTDAVLLDVARRSIERGLEEGRPLAPDPAAHGPGLSAPAATFVTLRSPEGELRGCIGSLEAERPLVVDVAENAYRAAFHDPRMEPIAPAELPALRIEISVLSEPEELPVHSREDLLAALRPGEDGLIVSDGGRRATFLPQVWEQLPTQDAFVDAIWEKAGRAPSHWSPTARAWRYTARKIA